MQVNDIVIFSPRQGETAEGIVTRVWDKPASDPYVTVRTVLSRPADGRTFVRCSSEVRKAGQGAGKSRVPAERGVGIGPDSCPAASTDHDSIVIREGRCAEHGGMDFAACPPAWEADLLAPGPAFDGPDYVTSRVTARPGIGA